MKNLKIIFLSLLMFTCGSVLAQEVDIEQVLLQERSGLQFFREGIQLGAGARAISMGGAYGALGDDYTASLWNPAALAQIRRFEVTGGFSHLSRDNSTSFNNNLTDDQFTLSNLNEVGFAYPVPTYRGSLVFSFGYNRVKTFDQNFALSDVFNSLPDDSVSQSWKKRENGALNNWTIAGAVDLSPNLSAGVGINFWSGNDDYQMTMREVDSENIYTFDDFRADDIILSEFTGFNVTLGALYRLNNAVRLSATLATPTTLTVKEEWEYIERTTFDLDAAEPDELFEEGDVLEYKIRSPLTLTGGGSINLIGLILVSGQIEYNDWKQLSFRSELPIELAISEDVTREITQDEANEAIENVFQATQRIRLGAELTLPGTATQFRAGFFRDPSPLKNDTDNDREYYSVGLGLLLDKQIKLDLAYVYGTWTEENLGLNDFVTERSEEVTFNKLFATVSVRF